MQKNPYALICAITSPEHIEALISTVSAVLAKI